MIVRRGEEGENGVDLGWRGSDGRDQAFDFLIKEKQPFQKRLKLQSP